MNSRRVGSGQELRFGDVIHVGFNRQNMVDSTWRNLRRLAFVLKNDYQARSPPTVDLSLDDENDERTRNNDTAHRIAQLAQALALNIMVEIPAPNNATQLPPPEASHLVQTICNNYESTTRIRAKYIQCILDHVTVDVINGVATITSNATPPANMTCDSWDDLAR